jgi:hypothetical protein
MMIISGFITLIVSIFRFIIPIKERNTKIKIQLLENRVEQLKKVEQIEFANEARSFENEISILNGKLRDYPKLISVMNFLVIISASVTFILAIIKFYYQ